MRKMKRFATLALTGAMVVGMSATAFAAPGDSATIKVNDIGEATLTYAQVIVPNERTATGWDIVDAYAESYTDAFGLTNDSSTAADIAAAEQTVLAMMIKKTDADAYLHDEFKEVAEAQDSQLDAALNNVLNTGSVTTTMANPQTVENAGVYVICANGEGYTYKAMSAYIGFGEAEDGTYPALKNAELNAKKIPTTITKKDDDSDNAVAIDQKITYTLETAFPYFKANTTDKTFEISDVISGASYVNLRDEGKTAKVTIGGKEVAADFVQNGNSFTVDLSAYVDAANSKAGQAVVVTYDAIVDETHVHNQATSHVGDTNVNSNEIDLYSGEITLLKYDAADPTKNIVLADAVFVVKNAKDEVLTFEYDSDRNVYKYNKDLEATPENTEITTGTDGKVKVEGLDLGTYSFTEVEAPEGYSINEKASTATLDIVQKNEQGEATAIFAAETDMSDTKLIALPGTGGVGTTMFTLGGCVIIAAAAGLLLANRRKEAR